MQFSQNQKTTPNDAGGRGAWAYTEGTVVMSVRGSDGLT
jgi:hypothetical protein